MTRSDRLLVGIDLGGTKIAAGLIDNAGIIVHRVTTPTPQEGSDAVLAALASTVAELARRAPCPPDAVGIAAPGIVDPGSGEVRSATSTLPGWAGTPLRDEMRRLTGLPVAVDNDVRVMALGELVYGAGRGWPDALFVSVGTGLGGAVVSTGTVLAGPHHCAGSFAHLLVPETGPIPCGCGRADHVEAVVSGPAIAAAYAVATENRGAGPASLSGEEVARRAANGDETARRCIHNAGAVLGRVLAGLLAAVDASIVVIGGGVAGAGPLFLDPLRDALHAEALTPLQTVPVVPTALGGAGPLLGAAVLAGRLT